MRKLPLPLCSIFFVFAILFGGLFPAHAATFYVDISTRNGTPTSSYGGPAGVTGFWNGVGNGTTNSLNNIAGMSTSVSVIVTSDTDNGSWSSSGSDRDKLFSDNIYVSGLVDPSNTFSINFSGLTNGAYDVYLCAPDNTTVGSGNLSVNGSSVGEIASGFTVKTTTVSGGTLSITGTPSAFSYAGLAGVQVCAVPIPGAVWLLGSGLIGIVGIRRKIKK